MRYWSRLPFYRIGNGCYRQKRALNSAYLLILDYRPNYAFTTSHDALKRNFANRRRAGCRQPDNSWQGRPDPLGAFVPSGARAFAHRLDPIPRNVSAGRVNEDGFERLSVLAVHCVNDSVMQ